MKALTIRQPWARAVATGVKRIETRSWRTHYRGRLLIHAASTFGPVERRVEIELAHNRVLRGSSVGQLGGIVGFVELIDCIPVDNVRGKLSRAELLLGDYSAGRWAWLLHEAGQTHFRACPGALGLWNFKS
jgi:activating signal cointegrator 1